MISIAWALVREAGQVPAWWCDVPEGLPDDWLGDWMSGQVAALWEIECPPDAALSVAPLPRIVESSAPPGPSEMASVAADSAARCPAGAVELASAARQSLPTWAAGRGRTWSGCTAAHDLFVWSEGNTLWVRPVPAGRVWTLPIWRELMTGLNDLIVGAVGEEALLVVGVDLSLQKLDECMTLGDLLGLRRLQ